VNDSGIYYGITLLDETDLLEANNRNKIELEYYGTKKYNIKNEAIYGISIIKKEYIKNKIKFLDGKFICNSSTGKIYEGNLNL